MHSSPQRSPNYSLQMPFFLNLPLETTQANGVWLPAVKPSVKANSVCESHSLSPYSIWVTWQSPKNLFLLPEEKRKKRFLLYKVWTFYCFSFHMFHSCMDQWLNKKPSFLLLSQGRDLEMVYLKWAALLLQLRTPFYFLYSPSLGTLHLEIVVIRFLSDFCFVFSD